MSVPRILAVLFFTNVLMAQQSAPPRFRIEPARPFDKERFAAALNLATGDHYHVVLYAGDALLERTDEDETYKYEAVEDSDAESLRRQLNEYGAKGYRVVGGLWGGMFPSRRLLMEKPPGRPNQYQYVLESGHRLKRKKLWAHDDFSQAPQLLASRALQGFTVRAQSGMLAVLEKAAEPTGDAALCSQPRCSELKVLDTHKKFANSLTEAGRRGLRFASAASIQILSSSTAVLTLFLADPSGSQFEYATIPAKYDDRFAATFQSAVADGYCARARVDDLIVLERKPGKTCEYRLIHGNAENAARDMAAAAAAGFRPALLNPQFHSGFRKNTVTYVILAERAGPGPK